MIPFLKNFCVILVDFLKTTENVTRSFLSYLRCNCGGKKGKDLDSYPPLSIYQYLNREKRPEKIAYVLGSSLL